MTEEGLSNRPDPLVHGKDNNDNGKRDSAEYSARLREEVSEVYSAHREGVTEPFTPEGQAPSISEDVVRVGERTSSYNITQEDENPSKGQPHSDQIFTINNSSEEHNVGIKQPQAAKVINSDSSILYASPGVGLAGVEAHSSEGGETQLLTPTQRGEEGPALSHTQDLQLFGPEEGGEVSDGNNHLTQDSLTPGEQQDLKVKNKVNSAQLQGSQLKVQTSSTGEGGSFSHLSAGADSGQANIHRPTVEENQRVSGGSPELPTQPADRASIGIINDSRPEDSRGSVIHQGKEGRISNSQSLGIPSIPSPYSSAQNDQEKEQSGRAKDPIIAAIFDSLAALSSQVGKLDAKLDAIEGTSSDLKGEISKVDSRVQGMTNQIQMVKEDLKKYDDKWETRIGDINDRLSKAESKWQGAETRWEKTRVSVHKSMETVQASVDSNSKRLITIEENLQEQKVKWSSLEKVERKIIKAAEGKFDELKTAVKHDVGVEILQEVRRNNEQIRSENRYEFLKGRASANKQHLVVIGVPEDSEKGDHEYVTSIFRNRLGLPHLDIVETFRLGNRPRPNAPRPLVAKFTRMGDRKAVWRRKSALMTEEEGEPMIWVQEYAPKQLRNDIRVLQRIARVARMNPEYYGEVFIKDYKVYINEQGFGMGNIRDLPKELQPEHVYTPTSDDTVVFFTRYSPLSNHFRSPFTLEDTSYSCVEQYLAQQKAILAGNEQLADRAMKSPDPADHKVILNSLKKDTQDQWRTRAEEIIPKAVRAKFNQNPYLASFLVETFPRAIGEASADRVWGIGLKLEDKDVLVESAWEKEGNLLGKTLAKVRQELIDSQPRA